jgi:hypothetical protein
MNHLNLQLRRRQRGGGLLQHFNGPASPSPAKTLMTPSWRKLDDGPSSKRKHIGLSRLASLRSGFIEAVREGTLASEA